MARGKIITKEKSEKIKELVRSGMNFTEVARILEISQFVVSKHAKDVKKMGQARRISAEERATIRKMRKQGHIQQDIANKFNCSLHTVYKHCKDIKVETKKKTILKALRNGEDLEKIVKKNGYDLNYAKYVKETYWNILEPVKAIKSENREMELLKQKQILEEKQQLRAKELEQLRQQEIKDFRWGGTVKIC